MLVGTDNHSGLFHNPTSDLSMANNAISFVTFFFFYLSYHQREIGFYFYQRKLRMKALKVCINTHQCEISQSNEAPDSVLTHACRI